MFCAFLVALLVQWLFGATSPIWWTFATLVGVVGTVKGIQQIMSMLPNMSTKEPKLPTGSYRMVRVRPELPAPGTAIEDAAAMCGEFEPCFTVALGALIVPYEALVTFVDAQFDSGGKHGLLLSSQELQHSTVHRRYNNFFFSGKKQAGGTAMPIQARLVFLAYEYLLWAIVWPLNKMFPPIVSGMVAVTESTVLRLHA